EILGSHLDVLPIGPAPQEIASGFREPDRLGHDFLHDWIGHVPFQSDYTRGRYGLNGKFDPPAPGPQDPLAAGQEILPGRPPRPPPAGRPGHRVPPRGQGGPQTIPPAPPPRCTGPAIPPATATPAPPRSTSPARRKTPRPPPAASRSASREPSHAPPL